MNKSGMINVPYISYEKEMDHKNCVIKIMGGVIFGLIVTMIVMFTMFMSFINQHDYTSYAQDGNGQNNINTGTQGDVINESAIENND